MTVQNPGEVVAAFDAAAAAGDESAAKAVCIRWDADGDAPGKLFRQATRKGFRLTPTGTHEHGDRAVVAVALLSIEAPSAPPVRDGKLRALDADKRGERLWLFVERHEGAWRLSGVSQSVEVASLFLDGVVGAGDGLSALPESAEAAAHVAGLLDRTSPDPDGARVRAEAPAEPTIAQARKVPGAMRHVVEIGGGERPGPWIVLERGADGFSVASVSRMRSLSALLHGLPVGYGLAATEDQVMADDKVKIKLDSPEAKAAMALALSEALKQLTAGGNLGGDKKGSEALVGLFQAALQSKLPKDDAAPAAPAAPVAPEAPAPTPDVEAGEDPVVDLASERKKRGIQEPSQLEQKVQGAVRDALNDYVANKVGEVEAGGEIPVNAEFLKEHGPALFSEVLQAFARSLIPEEIKIELPERSAQVGADAAAAQPSTGNAPVEGEAGDGPRVVPPKPGVKLKVDFNDIVSGLLSTLNKKPKDPGGNRGEGGEPG